MGLHFVGEIDSLLHFTIDKYFSLRLWIVLLRHIQQFSGAN